MCHTTRLTDTDSGCRKHQTVQNAHFNPGSFQRCSAWFVCGDRGTGGFGRYFLLGSLDVCRAPTCIVLLLRWKARKWG